ncbi:NAD-dependent epimerase/dehydratase family protein [Fortiea contorta]|uniref:NAD-dependent epimerase/dehydratase family protein n=1 Tax=Fortiea contorta TaxID=1892405 RepID=UPI00034A4619|nr:NAD-dependent epimerase/dehydratase family protein [Fortiea contorta]
MNLENKTVLITGIEEFIGLRTAELALAQGMKVRGLQTTKVTDKQVQNLGVEVIFGSINDYAIAQKACQGVDLVIHTAQLAQEAGALNDFRQINVDGAINIAKAAKSAGVKTFVHLSSVLVYGFNYPANVTESQSLSSENNPYCQTKIEAEAALLQLNNSPDFNVIIIRAGDVYGPGSIPWIVRPVHFMQQKLFACANDSPGIINHVYVDNLIDAMFLAAEKANAGEIFNITDGQETFGKDYFHRLAEISGSPAPLSLGKDEIKLFLKLRVQGQKLFRKKADILPESVDFMTRPHAYSINKAQTLLNYAPKINLEEGLRRTQEWLAKTDIQKLMK